MPHLGDVVEEVGSGGALTTDAKNLFAGPLDGPVLLHGRFTSGLGDGALVHCGFSLLVLGGQAAREKTGKQQKLEHVPSDWRGLV